MAGFLNALYSLTLLPHYLWHRCITGKYGDAAPEKLGCLFRIASPTRKCLWLHAVSVGEALAARTLVEAFAAAHPDWDIRISTTTATGREIAQKHFGAERVFYFPLDLSWAVNRAFDRIRPDLVVLMELEVWPNFLAIAEARGVPVAVANVRITERSVKRFLVAGRLAGRMLGRVALWLSQSDAYADSLHAIGVQPGRVHVVGSLKYDAVPTDVDEETRRRYRELLGAEESTLVLVAGSTHAGEDQPVIEAFCALQMELSESLLLVLVPRHPERAPDVAELAKSAGGVTMRSALTDGQSALTPVVVVDTVGELESLYAAADAVFMGGTLLASVGGHNMMEPCGLGRPTVVGPCIHNFLEPMAVLLDAEGVAQIKSVDRLTEVVGHLLSDRDAARAMAARGRKALLAKKGATARSVALLDGELSKS